MIRNWLWKRNRRLNGKFLLLLLGVAVLIGGGIHLLHGAQVKRSAKALLAQAKRAEGAGEGEKSEEYLSRYLAYEPDDAATLVRLGRMREARAQTPEQKFQVLRTYEKAVRQLPNDADTRRRLVRLAVPLGLFPLAKTHLEILRKSVEADGELDYLQGRCEEGTGKYQDAVEDYEEARKHEPTRIETYARLADLYRTQLKDAAKADLIMDARKKDGGLIAANPGSAPAYLMRAAYRQRYGVEGSSADDIEQALKLAPDDADVLLAAAQQASIAAEKAREKGDQAGYRRNLEQAVEHLKRGVELHKKCAIMYSALSRLEVQSGRPEEAEKRLREGLTAVVEGAPVLGYELAELLLENGRAKDAVDEFEKWKKVIRPELVRFFEARVAIAEGRWAQAVTLLESTAPELAAKGEDKELAKRAYLSLAGCYERLEDGERRTLAARRASDIVLPEPDPLAVLARLELASSLAAQGKVEEALSQYRLVLPKAPKAGYPIARLQIDQVSRRPVAQRDWAPIERTLDELGRLDPGNIKQPLLRAAVLSAKGEPGKASELLKKAEAEHPDRPEPWIDRASLVGQGGDAKAALAILDEARKRLGDRIELRLARADLLARGTGEEVARSLAELERGAEKLSPEERLSLWRGLGAAYARIGRDVDARRLLTDLATQRPDDMEVQFSLFDLALRTKDDALATRSLDRLRAMEGDDGAMWRFGRARLLIEQVRRTPGDLTRLAEAKKLLAQAAGRRPAWPRIPLAEAEVADLEGRTDQALTLYLSAVELGDRNPAAILRTLQLLDQKRQYKQALSFIQQLQEDVPTSEPLRRAAAEMAYKDGDFDLALRMAKGGPSDQSTDYRDSLLLGRIHAAKGQPAGPFLRRAVELAPTAPEAHATLIGYLASQRDLAAAKAALTEAERALPKDKAALTLARGHELVGDAERAASLFEAALKAAPDDSSTLRAVAVHYLRTNRIEDARSLMKRILEQKKDPVQTTWARRTLAQLTGLGGKPKDAILGQEFLDLDGGAGSGEVDPEDLRIKARILAQQPGRDNRRQAIESLEGVLKRQNAKASDLSLLAQLYEVDGDWAKARDHMLKLLNLEPKNPNHLYLFVMGLLRHDSVNEARVYLGRLEKLAPDQPGTIMLKARVLKADRKGREAIALLRDLARRVETHVGPVAQLLEEIGEPAEAETFYRRYVEITRGKRPAAVLDLALFLGRQDRVDEAMDLLDEDRVWKEIPAESVANAGIIILYEVKSGDEQQHQRLMRRLDEAIRREPTKDSLRFSLANVQMLQGRYDEAEASFLAIHERDKTRTAPLNNLAWMHALRGEGRADDAVKLINQAIHLEGELPNFLDTRALIQINAGRAELAISDLLDSIKADPQAVTYFHLARAYHLADKRTEAIDAFEKAKSLGLKVDGLHPLERESFLELSRSLQGTK